MKSPKVLGYRRENGKVGVRNHVVILPLDDLSMADVPRVGGKNASLGEMFRELVPKGVKVPNGFAVTADAYRHFLHSAGVDAKIRAILADLDTGNIENLRHRGRQVRQTIVAASFPDDLERAIAEVIREGHVRTYDMGGSSSTLEIGEAIAAKL